MTAVSRVLLLCALITVAFAAGGCASMSSLWHDMQPHRLHRWNRGPGMPSGPDVYSAAEDAAAVKRA